MFRPAVRSLLRHSYSRPTLLRPATNARTIFTTSSPKGSFKDGLVRWALAGGIVYWYATSNVFADEPKYFEEQPAGPSPEETDRPRSLLPERSLKRTLATTPIDEETTSTPIHEGTTATTVGTPGGVEELEEEAGQEGAFNPETGEINWDCPCLGGMAHGPCGEEFKTAFSCFVFSTEDPKGVDCIEKFKGMQNCFQKHPEIYGSELDGDEDEGEDGDQGGDEGEVEGSAASKASSPPAVPKDSSSPSPKPTDENIKSKSQNPPTPNSVNKTVTEDSKKEL